MHCFHIFSQDYSFQFCGSLSGRWWRAKGLLFPDPSQICYKFSNSLNFGTGNLKGLFLNLEIYFF